MSLPNQNPLGITQFGSFGLSAAQKIALGIAQGSLGTTGNVYYCDPVNGLDTNDGTSPSTAVQTLAAGYALLTSGHNDVLVLIGNGASSGTARISSLFTWAKDAAHLVGICAPSALSQRARIAPPTTATAFANFFKVTGNGCLFSNISWFHGFTAGVAAEICMTITGTRNAFINCDFEGMGDTTGATDAGSRSILIQGGENYFGHCNIGLDTVQRTNANASVEIKGGSPRNIFENCTFPFYSSDGLQYAFLANAAASMDRFTLFKGCNFIAGVGTIIAAMFKLVAGAGGLVCLDNGCGMFNVTAVGDATTKAQMWVSGGTATNGVKGVVAT